MSFVEENLEDFLYVVALGDFFEEKKSVFVDVHSACTF